MDARERLAQKAWLHVRMTGALDNLVRSLRDLTLFHGRIVGPHTASLIHDVGEMREILHEVRNYADDISSPRGFSYYNFLNLIMYRQIGFINELNLMLTHLELDSTRNDIVQSQVQNDTRASAEFLIDTIRRILFAIKDIKERYDIFVQRVVEMVKFEEQTIMRLAETKIKESESKQHAVKQVEREQVVCEQVEREQVERERVEREQVEREHFDCEQVVCEQGDVDICDETDLILPRAGASGDETLPSYEAFPPEYLESLATKADISYDQEKSRHIELTLEKRENNSGSTAFDEDAGSQTIRMTPNIQNEGMTGNSIGLAELMNIVLARDLDGLSRAFSYPSAHRQDVSIHVALATLCTATNFAAGLDFFKDLQIDFSVQLESAIRLGHLEIAQTCIDNGACMERGGLALYEMALRSGQFKILAMMYNGVNRSDKNLPDEAGMLALADELDLAKPGQNQPGVNRQILEIILMCRGN
jgi:hypothetical protein